MYLGNTQPKPTQPNPMYTKSLPNKRLLNMLHFILRLKSRLDRRSWPSSRCVHLLTAHNEKSV